MTDINSLVIVGRLTRDCGSDPNGRDFTCTQDGMCIARVSIAVNRSQKQNGQWVDVANFFDVTIFGKTAKNLKPYFVKGRQIVVSGHLQQERWKDQNGQNKSKISIIADDVQLAGGGNNNASQYNPQTVYPTAQATQMASAQANPQQYAPPQNQPQYPQQYQQIPQNQPQYPQQYQQIPQNQPQYPQQGQSMQNSQGNFPPPSDNEFPEDVPW